MPHISRDFPGRGAFTPSNPPRGQRCSLYAASERSDLLRRGLATSWYTRAAAGKFTLRSASGTPARGGTRDARPRAGQGYQPGRRNHPAAGATQAATTQAAGAGTPGRAEENQKRLKTRHRARTSPVA